MTQDEARAALIAAGADSVSFNFEAREDICGIGIEFEGGKRNAVVFRSGSSLRSAVGVLKGWMFRERELRRSFAEWKKAAGIEADGEREKDAA